MSELSFCCSCAMKIQLAWLEPSGAIMGSQALETVKQGLEAMAPFLRPWMV